MWNLNVQVIVDETMFQYIIIIGRHAPKLEAMMLSPAPILMVIGYDAISFAHLDGQRLLQKNRRLTAFLCNFSIFTRFTFSPKGFFILPKTSFQITKSSLNSHEQKLYILDKNL